MSDCTAASATKKFCSIRADSNCIGCPETGGNYREVCGPDWAADAVYKQLYKGKPIDKRHEAHHILCVSPVTKVLAGNPDIQPAIAETEWCINNKDNMVAMPLWGHTVRHYIYATQEAEGDLDKLKAPAFENWPQHNIDHNSSEGYTQEIHDECTRIAFAIEKSGHKLKGDALKKKLDKLSGEWLDELKRRGSRRQGGTHRAWKMGARNPEGSSWIHPFSMASDAKIGKVGFPVRTFDAKVAAWMERLAKAMS
jgi:A nuclease family of the HNH/ENDO VII superfamily with conserved AHH